MGQFFLRWFQVMHDINLVILPIPFNSFPAFKFPTRISHSSSQLPIQPTQQLLIPLKGTLPVPCQFILPPHRPFSLPDTLPKLSLTLSQVQFKQLPFLPSFLLNQRQLSHLVLQPLFVHLELAVHAVPV